MKVNVIVLLMLGLLGQSFAHAADYSLYANVTKIVRYADGTVGNCAVELSPITAIEDQTDLTHGNGVGQCKIGFISLDCTATYTSSKAAQGFMDSASIALVTGNQLYIEIDPTSKHGGYCTARRVDSLNS